MSGLFFGDCLDVMKMFQRFVLGFRPLCPFVHAVNACGITSHLLLWTVKK